MRLVLNGLILTKSSRTFWISGNGNCNMEGGKKLLFDEAVRSTSVPGIVETEWAVMEAKGDGLMHMRNFLTGISLIQLT